MQRNATGEAYNRILVYNNKFQDGYRVKNYSTYIMNFDK